MRREERLVKPPPHRIQLSSSIEVYMAALGTADGENDTRLQKKVEIFAWCRRKFEKRKLLALYVLSSAPPSLSPEAEGKHL